MPAAEHVPAARARGFTLIELMIVVAIVAVLASLAYPSYTRYVKRGQRAGAQVALNEAAQFMQRYYSANNAYDRKPGDTTKTVTDTSLAAREPAQGAQGQRQADLRNQGDDRSASRTR